MRSSRPTRCLLPIVVLAALAGQTEASAPPSIRAVLQAGVHEDQHAPAAPKRHASSQWPAAWVPARVILPALDARARGALAEASYLMVTVPDSWTKSSAHTALYRRVVSGWQLVDGPHPSNVGSAGVSWGRGLTSPPLGQPVKREGDRTAPAGLFELGQLYGNRLEAPAGLSLPYTTATLTTHCVDDASAPEYGRIVQLAAGEAARWTSSENLGADAPQNTIFGLIGHNGLVGSSEPIPGGGSCIFLHGGAREGGSTLGCTSLDTEVLERMLARIDATGAEPPRTVYALLPRDVYAAATVAWGLPAGI